MNPESYLAGNAELIEAYKVFRKAMEVISSRNRMDSWAVPVGLVRIQTLPLHIMYLLENMYGDATSNAKCRHTLVLQ